MEQIERVSLDGDVIRENRCGECGYAAQEKLNTAALDAEITDELENEVGSNTKPIGEQLEPE
jgi:hypothetical protein